MTKMHVNFIHLDLGLGGAERLVVDAACALKLRGHSVLIATSHHDPHRCFDETNPSIDGLISRDIRCAGDWIPRHALGGRFHLLFAVLRMVFAAIMFGNQNSPQVLIVDQVSFIVPLLRLIAPRVPVLFYCHFPDKLLAPKSKSPLRRLYRFVFDRAEEWTTNKADCIVVNSKFTAGVVREVFPAVARRHQLSVLYPCVDLQTFDGQAMTTSEDLTNHFSAQPQLRKIIETGECFVLSINRFERKKGLDLALQSFHLLPTELKNKAYLVMAGGYDIRVKENVDHLMELQTQAKDLGLIERVFFVPSCSQEEKRLLLERCRVLVYTPQGEHFGIVPIEAGACSKPVIACNSGGPLESIAHEETGLLVDPSSESFARAMKLFLENAGAAKAKAFGDRARKRVEQMFSRDAFGAQLEKICVDLVEVHKKGEQGSGNLIAGVMVVILAALFALVGLSVYTAT